jgi:hypothetical protein
LFDSSGLQPFLFSFFVIVIFGNFVSLLNKRLKGHTSSVDDNSAFLRRSFDQYFYVVRLETNPSAIRDWDIEGIWRNVE